MNHSKVFAALCLLSVFLGVSVAESAPVHHLRSYPTHKRRHIPLRREDATPNGNSEGAALIAAQKAVAKAQAVLRQQ
jgi:hypothetical protein